MQIWESVNIFVFIWKWYVKDFTLKHLFLGEICAVVVSDVDIDSHTSSDVIRRQRSCDWFYNFVRTIGSFVLFTGRQLAIASIAVSFFLVVVEQ